MAVGDFKISDCVAHEGKVYCVTKGGKIVVIQITEIDLQECPQCVAEEIFKRL